MSVPTPRSDSTLSDGGLKIVGSRVSRRHFKIGTCSAGTAGNTYAFQGTDTSVVKTTLGKGPLVNSTIDSLIKSGGQMVFAHKPLTVATAGASSAVTAAGTSPPAVTLTGAPYDDANMKSRIVTGGVRATATFQYSTDGGVTWSDVITTAATYLLPTGVTMNFASGTYVNDNTYAWTDAAPILSSANISAAIDTIIGSPLQGRFIHVIGQPADAATLLTIATMCDAKMLTAYNAKKPMFCLLEAPAVDKALLIAAFTNIFVSDFVSINGGFEDYTNENGGTVDKVSIGRGIAGRIARTPLGVCHNRLPDDSDLGPMSGVVRLVPDGAAASTGYNDENSTPGLNDARFNTMQTIPNKDGFFCNTRTMAASTSDYQELELLRIAIEIVALYNAWSAGELSARVRKSRTTGFILPMTRVSLQDDAEAFILDGLKNENGDSPIDGIRVIINDSDNLIADKTLRGKIRTIPPSFVHVTSFDIAFATSLT